MSQTQRMFYRSLSVAFMTLLLIAGIKTETKASHLGAADIYVTYVGAGADGCSGTTEYKYVITLDVYRACENGASAPTTARIFWASTNAGFNDDRNITNPIRDTLDELCAAFKDSNSCRIPSSSSPYPAFIRHRFIDTIILPSAQTDWRFWWSSCCRNSGIVNLQNNGAMYVEAGLNNLTKYNNSTPRFIEPPLPYTCANQPTTYANTPWDPNKDDSIRTELQEVYSAAGTQIAYQAPNYSLADPIQSTPGNPFSFDPSSGSATFTPVGQGKYVMGFRCYDYERGTGTSLGYSTRDIQITIFNCSAPPPAVDSLPLNIDEGSLVDFKGKKTLVVCPGSNVKFEMNTESQNPTSNIYLQATTGPFTGSSFNVTGAGTNKVSGIFTWTPTIGDLGEKTLYIYGKDSTCTGGGFSIVLRTIKVIPIVVLEGLDAGPDLPFCDINPDSVQLFARGTDNLSFSWSIAGSGGTAGLSDPTIHNPRALPFTTTSYIISTPDLKGACKARDTVSVFKDTTNRVVITPKNPNNPKDAMVLCRPGYVQLEALLDGKPPKNNVKCGIGNPTICSDPDTATIFGSRVYGRIPYDTIGGTTPIMYNSLRTFKQQYLIRRNEITSADMFSATMRSIGFETKGTTSPNYEYSNFRIFIACTDKEELKASDGFEDFGLTQVYSSTSETMEDGVHYFPFTTPYTWDTTKNIIVQICYGNNATVEAGCGVTSAPPVIPFVPTTYVSGLALPAANPTVLSVCGTINSAAIQEIPARPIFRFSYCEADPLDFFITWKNGEYLSDSTITQPLAYVPKTTRFVVHTVGRSECIMTDTLDVYVPNNEYKIEPTDTAICFGEQTPISAYGGFKYQWWEYENGSYVDASNSLSCTDCPEPVFSPKKTTTYRLAVSDSVFCFDTFEVNMEILPLPDVRILTTDDTTIKYGKSFQMLVSGARLYNWSPVSSLNNPNISYPVARPLDDTRYVVSGIGANGCKAYDTLHVTVDERDKLFIPSAFSPNADGKNDVFRVANLTFQRILEFRVFNRWGEEVYSTNDSRAGWDGTFGGKKQDMGTYSYMIRVSFPDGYVETYSGEVTLIR